MTRREFLETFILVRRCGGCGDILGANDVGRVLCDQCRIKWNAATLESCPICFASANECTCMPKTLSKSGALCLRKLFFYEKENSFSVEMSMLYLQKNKKINRVNEFLSEQLCRGVLQELDAIGAVDNAVVTYVPRSKRARASYGFDQAKRLAKALSEKLGCECVRMFDTRVFAKKQKQLTSRQRLANAKKNLVTVKKTPSIEGKYVVLIDDMVTTGANMAVCVKYLAECKAKGVICASIASRGEKQ